ncbi:type II secretion system protein [Endothiovibrio diazotrophicus]
MTPTRRAAGFTLIEMIITIVLLTIGSVLTFTYFGPTLTNANRNAELLQAGYLARESIEDASAAECGNVPALTNQVFPGFPNTYVLNRTVTTVAPNTSFCTATMTCCERVAVSVTINNVASAQKSIELSAN